MNHHRTSLTSWANPIPTLTSQFNLKATFSSLPTKLKIQGSNPTIYNLTYPPFKSYYNNKKMPYGINLRQTHRNLNYGPPGGSPSRQWPGVSPSRKLRTKITWHAMKTRLRCRESTSILIKSIAAKTFRWKFKISWKYYNWARMKWRT